MQWLHQAIDSLLNQCPPLESVCNRNPHVALAVQLNKESPTQEPRSPHVGPDDAQSYDLDFGATFLTRSQEPKAAVDGVLDMIILSLQRPILGENDAKHQSLAPLEVSGSSFIPLSVGAVWRRLVETLVIVLLGRHARLSPQVRDKIYLDTPMPAARVVATAVPALSPTFHLYTQDCRFADQA